LAVVLEESIEQQSPGGVRQRLENLVHGLRVPERHYATFWLHVKGVAEVA
jgi:hypothetical protein